MRLGGAEPGPSPGRSNRPQHQPPLRDLDFEPLADEEARVLEPEAGEAHLRIVELPVRELPRPWWFPALFPLSSIADQNPRGPGLSGIASFTGADSCSSESLRLGCSLAVPPAGAVDPVEVLEN